MEKILADSQAVERMLARLAHEIIEKNPCLSDIALIGILRRGASLASMRSTACESAKIFSIIDLRKNHKKIPCRIIRQGIKIFKSCYSDLVGISVPPLKAHLFGLNDFIIFFLICKGNISKKLNFVKYV